MKIEKISENQIRCTLTAGDLMARKLKLSELAYGSEKAKMLFKDVMAQADAEYGFEADDIPLMIEAIPVNSDCLVLNVTKVEDPEEFDTRFAKFAPSVIDDEDTGNVFENLLESFTGEIAEHDEKPESPVGPSRVHIYSFESLSDVIRLAHVAAFKKEWRNTLYKDNDNGLFYLALYTDTMPSDLVSGAVNSIAEYGRLMRSCEEKDAYLSEHCEILVSDSALWSLKSV